MVSRLLGRVVLGAVVMTTVALGLSDCSCNSRAKNSCGVSDDCVAQGIKNARCVNGQCTQVCASDNECSIRQCSPGDNACLMAMNSVQICEDSLCVTGCSTDNDCGGDTCINHRCYVYFESFEGCGPLKRDQAENTVAAHCGDKVHCTDMDPRMNCWNGIAYPAVEGVQRKNDRTRIVAQAADCDPAQDGDEVCAGPAGDGIAFLAIQVVPTTARGTPEIDVTCEACACCRACRDPSARASGIDAGPDDAGNPTDGGAPPVLDCLGAALPDLPDGGTNACMASAPAACQQACTACDMCTQANPPRSLLGLYSCESEAAQHDCDACTPYRACLKTNQTMISACSQGSGPFMNGNTACMFTSSSRTEDCSDCFCGGSLKLDCRACRDGADTSISPVLSSSAARRCAAQGAAGCYPTPVDILRSGLTDDEQSIDSFKIPAVGANSAGTLILSFEYVAFNIGRTFTQVKQNQPRESWPVIPQEVVVQLCGGNCTDPMSWSDAQFTDMTRASIPSDDQRDNGLGFGNQDSHDWAGNYREIQIPTDKRTADFQIRFVPRLADAARVGIDRIQIRRRM
jgi:hypothetical protein